MERSLLKNMLFCTYKYNPNDSNWIFQADNIEEKGNPRFIYLNKNYQSSKLFMSGFMFIFFKQIN